MLPAALLLLLLSTGVQADPLTEAARALGRSGFRDAAAPEKSPARFKPDGTRRVVAAEARLAGEDDAQRKAFEDIFLKLLEGYEKTAKELGHPDDGAAALAFSVSVVYAAATEKELDDEAFLALISRLQASLDVPSVRGATDAQKQEFYERTLCAAGMVLAMAQLAETPAAKAGLRKLAAVQLLNLLGVEVERLTLKGKDVSIKVPAAAGAAADGFTFTPPEGWKVEGGWHVYRKTDPNDSAYSTAFVRFPPAIEAGPDIGATLRDLWKSSVPAELAGRHSSMVYRRYVGDGLPAHFVHGAGREKDRRSDSLYTLYLLDLGARWQPVVVAMTYDDPGMNVASIVQMSTSFSFPGTAAIAEGFLATLRCPAARGRALVSKEALIGDYAYGSAAGLQWENIYTGATTMTAVSYSGTLDLKADGTFSSTFVSASGVVGAQKFAGEKDKGRWDIAGDLLVLTGEARERKYRIGGITQFADGVKVVILLMRLDLPVNATTANDRSEWYSTKKK